MRVVVIAGAPACATALTAVIGPGSRPGRQRVRCGYAYGSGNYPSTASSICVVEADALQCPWARVSAPRNDEFPTSSSACKNLVGRKLVRDHLRSVRTDMQHVLDVPVIDVGLHRDHHALLEPPRIVAGDHRLLLMPPGADAVAGEHRFVGHAPGGKALDDKPVDVACGPSRHQLLIR